MVSSTYHSPEPKPVAWAHYPPDFFDNFEAWAKHPWLQRLSAYAGNLSEELQVFLVEYAGALERATTGGGDFDDERDGFVSTLAKAMVTDDPAERQRVLDRFHAWQTSEASR